MIMVRSLDLYLNWTFDIVMLWVVVFICYQKGGNKGRKEKGKKERRKVCVCASRFSFDAKPKEGKKKKKIG